MKKTVVVAALSLAGCQSLYVPHEGSVPHGYQDLTNDGELLEAAYESYKRVSPEEACEMAERRVEELAAGRDYEVMDRAADVREDVAHVAAQQGVVTAPDLAGNRGEVHGVMTPAYDIVHEIKRCVVRARVSGAAG